MALLPGGAAVGVGTTADYPGTTTPITTDQRGMPLDSPPDIGAFQLSPSATAAVVVSTETLNLGTTAVGTAGAAQTFTVSGSGLSAGIILTAPTGVELSDDGGSSYSPTFDLSETGGTVGTTTIDVRISASASVGSVNGGITASSTGATTQDVSVTGTVTSAPVPAVVVSAETLNLGSTTAGTAGIAQTFTVNGNDLSAGIVLTAPTGVELSDNGGSSYSTTLDLSETGGAVRKHHH